jgi:porin
MSLAMAWIAIAAQAHAGQMDSLWQRETLAGDWGGVRSQIEADGFRPYLNLTTEVFGNVAGGARRGSAYEDLVEIGLDTDLERTVGWTGALVHVNGYLTHGRGVSAHFLGNNYLTVSNIEADRGDRLFDFWLQQTLLKGALSIRVGQIAASDEFFVSRSAALFLNGSYGWPAIMSANLPSGGPNYPLATPGFRVTYAATDRLSVKIAAFNGDPAGRGAGAPLARDPSGTAFRLDGGTFLIGELSLRGAAAENNPAAYSEYKIGAWYHTSTFADVAGDAQGRSLADPASSAVPAYHHGNGGVYVIADRVFAQNGDGHPVTAFVRASLVPNDRNVISTFVDAGATIPGLRKNDLAGIAFTYARMSDSIRTYDRDARRFLDPMRAIRNFEGNIELTYQASIAPWWIVQPDVQIVIHPGGNIALTQNAPPIRNAVVLGLRSITVF